jgi:hypothetical protein
MWGESECWQNECMAVGLSAWRIINQEPPISQMPAAVRKSKSEIFAALTALDDDATAGAKVQTVFVQQPRSLPF